MSLRSFNQKKKLGLTGLPTTETCFAGMCDRMTPEAEVSEYTYRQYSSVMRNWRHLEKKGTNTQNAVIGELYGLIAHDLGGFTIQSWEFYYAHKANELAKALARLRDKGMRIVLDTVQRNGEVHSVGIKPLEDGRYRVVGYGLPTPLIGNPVEPKDIHPFLYESGYNVNSRRPYIGANIVGLPIPGTKATASLIPTKQHKK